MSNRALALAASVLVALALVRAWIPERPPLVRLSVEGITIHEREVPTDTTLDMSATWDPPADVLVLGWTYQIGATPGTLYLTAHDGTVLISAGPKHPTLNPAQLPGGAFLVRRGQPLSLRYVVPNTGPTGPSGETWARVYFVAAEGN